jgi:transcriptional regulator with XRE-family HTH domain
LSRKDDFVKIRLNLKEIRIKKGITQIDLAKKLNIKQSTISKFENGTKIPSLERTVEIANILGISIDELIQFNKFHNEYSKEMKKRLIK